MNYNNIKWHDEEMFENFKNTSGLILDYKLALENYEDFNNVKLDKFSEIEKMWYNRENSKLTNIELLALAKKVLESYKTLVNEIGIENFIIYKDGGIEYKN